MSPFDVFASLVILAVLVAGLMYVVTDIGDLCREQMDAEEVGVDGASAPPLGLTATTTTVGANASRREWPLASSRPHGKDAA